MARSAKKAPPRNPVTDAHVAQFDLFVQKWRDLLNLRDWRIVRSDKREKKNMAAVLTVEHPHKLARYAVGTDFGATPVNAQTLEATALHEVFHVFFRPLIDVCIAEGEYSEAVDEAEHAAIIVLEDLLSKAYASKTV